MRYLKGYLTFLFRMLKEHIREVNASEEQVKIAVFDRKTYKKTFLYKNDRIQGVFWQIGKLTIK